MKPMMVAPSQHPESGLRLRQEETLQLLKLHCSRCLVTVFSFEEGSDVSVTALRLVTCLPGLPFVCWPSEDALFSCASSG